jgi:hypothetical protein
LAAVVWAIGTVFAADTTAAWLFTNSGDYILSDNDLIEVVNNIARLKVRNYSSDANTMLLLHFDESGGEATDSSSYGNLATNSAVTFAAGNLNNAGSFNGQSSFIRVADSSSLDLTSNNTLEAWVKFSQSFSAGSTASHAGVMDKGAYKLYFNSSTGKLQYELANSSVATWTQQAGNDVKGSWDLNGKLAVHSSTSSGSYIYVGTGNQTADAEVWMWNGTEWSQIGGDGKNDSWADQVFESVLSLAAGGSYVYAGLGTTAGDAEVWRWDGAGWTKIGGDGINSSWAVNTYEGVYSLNSLAGSLYAGLGSTAGDAEVWKWNGSSWTKIGGDGINSGWTTNYEYVFSLVNDGTNLYAGLGSTAGDAEVWKWNGSSWTKIGGDAVNSSWADATYEYVMSMSYYGGALYAGLGSTAGDAEVWRWDGAGWTKIGGDAVNSSWADATYEGVYSLVNDGTNLYAGLGASTGDNEVWRWDGASWTKIGGDGINSGFTTTHAVVETMVYAGGALYAANTSTSAAGEFWSWNGSSWTKIGGNFINKSWGFYGLQSVESMVVAGNYLYAGTGVTTAGNALVFQFDGSTWTLIGGQGVNNSWTAGAYESVTGMVSYGTNLAVGLGTSANDAEVWLWNGSSWTKIGGDSINSGWTTNYETVSILASDGPFLYAGLGNSANDAEVWKWNGSSWTKIGGDSVNSGWTTNYESVLSAAIYQGNLYVGLGVSAGDAEIWRWDQTVWSKVGGDAVNSSWANSLYEDVDYLTVCDGKLYAGLGTTTDDAELWQYDGTVWTKIGGDDANDSWTAGTYEQVKTLTVYNGELYAGLGNGTGDGELWKWDQTSWTKIGGQSLNGGWTNAIEYVSAASVYLGKLYVGLGYSANADAAVYSWGGNAVLTSATASWDTNWHHVAAAYDGSTMRLYLDGVLDNSVAASVTMPSVVSHLLVGGTYGGEEAGIAQGLFPGTLEEIRISNSARSSFNTTPYTADSQTVRPAVAVLASGIKSFDTFTATSSAGTVTFRLSSDGGTTWRYWNGSGWAVSVSTTEANSAATVNTNFGSFPVGSGGIIWQAVLQGDGSQQTSLSYVQIGATLDNAPPENPAALTAALSASGGGPITTNNWYPHTGPYFSWEAGTDTGGSGVAGYYVYFGTDPDANPLTYGSFQTETAYTASSLVSGQTYYLLIRTVDNAQNVSSATWQAFIYKFDNIAPTNPVGISVSPAGYASDNSFSFSWPAGTDSGSLVAGYQYKTATASGIFANWSATTSATMVALTEVAYQSDTNIFYLRTVDNAGNNSSPMQINFYFAGDGASPPRLLTVNPATNTTNSFAFSWQPPETHLGDDDDLTYCYTVNTLPSATTCNFTSTGATSLAASAFATQVGLNTFYLVAKNPEDSGGAISYGSYASVTFTADTSSPGIPNGLEISDVSIKSSEAWKIALSWVAPTDTGSGVASYQVARSEDDLTYATIASTTGLAYVDTGLDQKAYYYKVRACDNVYNCGAYTEALDLYPTGRYTEPAALSSGPAVSSITTKKATISWSTDRNSDSKVAYGVSAGSYYSSEPSNSTQTTDHTITLTNLSPGTTYYYKAKWTDEDGNTGASSEKSFATGAAPTVKDVSIKTVGLTSVILQFTTSNASSVKIYYGETTAFGGVKTMATSTSETVYTATLDDLKDGTKYYYKINTFDSESAEYEGTILNFATLPRPKITGVKIQQVVNTAQPTVLVSWATNTEVSSIITYYQAGDPSSAKDEVNVALLKGEHKMLIRSLLPETPYTLIVKGRDKAGNEASSDPQRLTTATDTRPPQISDLKVESTTLPGSSGAAAEAQAQLLVSWNTDEPGGSQVEFGEGTGSTYAQKTQEDANLTMNHLVVISGLTPAKVYHLRALSKDKAGNESKSVDTTTITPKATDNALDLVITNLQQAFGFLGAGK